MVDDLRTLETKLKTIRVACRDSIQDDTGAVSGDVIAAQAAALKLWLVDFENAYLLEAKTNAKNASKIITAGRRLSEDAWFCYESLLNVEIDARGPPPVMVRWENLPSGVVFAEQKADLLLKLKKLTDDYHSFRRSVILH